MTIPLRLAIDASGMRQGGQQAEQSIRTIQQSSRSAVRDLESMNRELSRSGSANVQQPLQGVARSATQVQQSFGGMSQSLAVASSGLAISGRVQQLSTGLDSMTGSLRGASQGLLITGAGLVDVSRLLVDFRAASDGAAKSGGLLASVWRANPVLLIATGLTAVAAAMALFGDETESAAIKTKSLTESIRELNQARSDQGVLFELGLLDDDPRARLRQQAERLGRASRDIRERGEPITLDSLRELLGPDVSRDALNRLIRPDSLVGVPGTGTLTFTATQGLFEAGRLSGLSAENAADILLARGRFLANQSRVPDEQVQSIRAARDLEAERDAAIPRIRRIERDNTQELRAQREERDRLGEALDAYEERMARLRDTTRQAGEAFGAAFFDAVGGAQSAREAVVSLIQDLGRIASRQAIQGLGVFFGNTFGSSPAQQDNLSPGNPYGYR